MGAVQSVMARSTPQIKWLLAATFVALYTKGELRGARFSSKESSSTGKASLPPSLPLKLIVGCGASAATLFVALCVYTIAIIGISPITGGRVRDPVHIFSKLEKRPFGKWIFSELLGFISPYTASLRPRIVGRPLVARLSYDVCEIQVDQRRAIENPFRSIHAAAIANMGEASAFMLALGFAEKNGLRAVPVSIKCDYESFCRGQVKAVSTIPQELYDWVDPKNEESSPSLDGKRRFVVSAEIRDRETEKRHAVVSVTVLFSLKPSRRGG